MRGREHRFVKSRGARGCWRQTPPPVPRTAGRGGACGPEPVDGWLGNPLLLSMTVPPANVDRTSRPAGRARGPSTLQMGTAAHGHPQACPHRAVGAGAHPGRFCLQSPLPHWLTNTRPAVLWWRLRDEEGRGLPSRAPASLAARQQAGGGMEERSSWPGCLGPSRRRPTSLHAGPWGRAAAPRGPSVRTRPPPPRRGWPRPSSVTHGVPRCGVSSAPGGA